MVSHGASAPVKKIFLETFGCQMNVLDSELVASQLAGLGYSFTSDLARADVVLYNTCSVRDLAEQKVWSRLGRLKTRKAKDPSLVVGVIGCMAERDGVSLMKRMPHVDLMCGPSELDQLPALLENVLLTGRQQHALAGNTARRSKTIDHTQDQPDGLELLDLSRSFSPRGAAGGGGGGGGAPTSASSAAATSSAPTASSRTPAAPKSRAPPAPSSKRRASSPPPGAWRSPSSARPSIIMYM